MSAKRLILCTAIGMVLLAGGLTAFSYGLAQVIETGSCGTDEYGRSVGPPCPAGTGWMIMAMVGGVFAAVGGAFTFAGRGASGGLWPLILGPLCAAASAAVLGIVDVHAADTRPGREVMWIPFACAALVALVGATRGRRPVTGAGEPSAAARKTAQNLAAALRQVAAQRGSDEGHEGVSGRPDRTAQAEDIAARLRQLDQLRQSGLLPEDDYAERRRQILAEL